VVDVRDDREIPEVFARLDHWAREVSAAAGGVGVHPRSRERVRKAETQASRR
jgi:hypothetical protein